MPRFLESPVHLPPGWKDTTLPPVSTTVHPPHMSSQPNALLSGAAPLAAPAPLPEVQTPAVEALATDKPLVAAKERFVYLDAMKGIMILWGIPVHACTVSNSEFFRNVAKISGWARMEAFFLISGFLSYMLIKRYGNKTIFLRRLVAVGIPLLSVLLLLNPITNYLVLKYHNGAAAPSLGEFFSGHIASGLEGTWGWHLHVWFLLVLLSLATVSGPAVSIVDAVLTWSRPKFRRLPDAVLLFVLSGCLAFCALAARVVFEEVVKGHTSESFHYLLRSIGYYAGFYCFGLAMFASRRILGIITSFHWIQLAVSAILMGAIITYQDHFSNRNGEIIRLLSEVYFAVTFVSVLFTNFKALYSDDHKIGRVQFTIGAVLMGSALGLQYYFTRRTDDFFMLVGKTYFALAIGSLLVSSLRTSFSRESKVMHFIVESAFCVYLFHYIVIYLSAFALRPYIKDEFTLSLLVTLVTAGVTMLIYEFAVRRNTALRCLFLGKMPKRKA